MKGYTSLSQSKKLAEFLPLKSADMFYNPRPSNEIPYVGNANTALLQVPCWSLATLLGVLPDEISTGEGYQNKYEIDIRRHYGGNNITLYQIAYGNNKGSSGNWHDMISTSEQEKFVDVCYEVIIKLHEMNLL